MELTELAVLPLLAPESLYGYPCIADLKAVMSDVRLRNPTRGRDAFGRSGALLLSVGCVETTAAGAASDLHLRQVCIVRGADAPTRSAAEPRCGAQPSASFELRLVISVGR